MVYKALYRTYRPQTFEALAGQEHVVKTLQNAVKENRIGHAYLFCGPRGTGKTTVAKILAKAINCEDPDHKPCNHCTNCRTLMEGDHPDIIEIDAASNNGVDEVRNLIDKVKYAPIQGKYKVYIIDEVHMMSQGAFNALLKTLEEPPSHVVFILATTEPQKVLTTIVSRCQRFDFTRVSEQDIITRLYTVIKEEHVHCDEDAIEMIAKLSDGGMRDALSILEQCLAYSPEHLTLKDINEVYGLISSEQKIQFLRILLGKNMQRVLQYLDQLMGKGTDIKRLTYDLIDILKDVVIDHHTKDTSLLKILTKSNIGMISPFMTTEDCFQWIDILLDAANHYALNTNPYIYFELAILKICHQFGQLQEKVKKIEDDISIDEERVEVSTGEEMIEEVQEPKVHFVEENAIDEEKEEKESSLEESPTEENKISLVKIAFDDVLNILVQADRRILNEAREKWKIIPRYMANMNTAKYASMLSGCEPVAAAEGGLILSFEFQPEANLVNYFENYKGVKNFITEILGRDFEFIAVTRTNWIDIRNQYLKLRQINQLPVAKPITLTHIERYKDKEEKNTLTESQLYAQNLFGDIVEFTEESYEH